MTDPDTRARTWRQNLHRIPETAFEEHATSDYVAAVLTEIGFDVTRGVGGVGVAGSLTRGTSTQAIGLRADMDALPITEVEEREHGSRHPGRMHACGHDGHMATVLGAAAALATRRCCAGGRSR
ncbi:MAG: M20/M25/M40 family metallo-hydrolase [Dermatophilaceae bacterium]